MSGATANDGQVLGLVQAAERAAAGGQGAEFAQLLSQAQALAPGHPLVLNLLGVQELYRGNAPGARTLLERALQLDDRNPAMWINLATAFRQLQLAGEEMQALEHALALDPRHLLALLQKASLLTTQGKTRAAAKVYQNAVQSIPRGAKLPQHLISAVQKAIAAVNDKDAELAKFLQERVGEAGKSAPPGRNDRYPLAVDMFLGKVPVHAQHPTFFYFPRLPAPEFFPREEFPWLQEVEADTAQIRHECQQAIASEAGKLEPYIAYPQGVPLDQWAELNHSRKWSAFYLWRDGTPVTENLQRCPHTARALARIPRVEIPGYAPTAFFSILDAKTRIPPHTGVTNTRSIVHLPLVVPPGCGFRVGWETRQWREGEAWVFDDTYEHTAWNDSDVPRAILIFDVWNPYLSPGEREQVSATVQAIKEFYRGEIPVSTN